MGRLEDLLTVEAAGQLPPEMQRDLDTLREAGVVPPKAGEEAPAEPEAPTFTGALQRRVVDPIRQGLSGAADALTAPKVELPLIGEVPEPVAGLVRPIQAGLRAALPIIDAPGEVVGAGVEAATGSETAGDVAAFGTNLLVPGAIAKSAGVGRKLATELAKTAEEGTLVERAGVTAQKAIQRTKDALYGAARGHYDEAANIAEQAGTRVQLNHMSAATKEAEKMLEEFAERLPKGARDIVEEIATNPGNVSYAQWDQIRGRIHDMALRPEQYATSDRFVPKAMTKLDRLVKDGLRKSVEGTPAEQALNAADSTWKEASDFNRLVGKRTHSFKTGTEVESALTDPKRLRAALGAMTPEEAKAFKTLRRAATLQEPTRGITIGHLGLGALGKVGKTALAAEGGHLYAKHAGSEHPVLIGTLSGLSALALGNPRLALLVAKGFRTPAGMAAATKITTELTRLLASEEGE